MTDIELLRFPEYLRRGYKAMPTDTHEAECKYYARDCAKVNTEALRAEVEAWRELADHVRAGACNAIWPDRYTDARIRDVAAALKRAERLAEALDITTRGGLGS